MARRMNRTSAAMIASPTACTNCSREKGRTTSSLKRTHDSRLTTMAPKQSTDNRQQTDKHGASREIRPRGTQVECDEHAASDHTEKRRFAADLPRRVPMPRTSPQAFRRPGSDAAQRAKTARSGRSRSGELPRLLPAVDIHCAAAAHQNLPKGKGAPVERQTHEVNHLRRQPSGSLQ